MEENKNISFKYSLESYNKKYRNRREKILKYTKKQVEDFDKKYQGKVDKNYLLKGRKWALIGDTYYEIPQAPTLKWYRNLSVGAQVGICALLGGGVATSVAVPLALNLHTDVSKYFTVTFDTNGGVGEFATQKVKDGELVSKPTTDPTQDGYMFESWNYQGVPYDFNTPVHSDMLIRASWNGLFVDVTFKNKDGSTLTTKSVIEGKYVTAPTVEPTTSETGMTFDYWYKENESEPFDFDNTKIKENITLLPHFAESYTITFKKTQGGETFSEVKVIKGRTVSRPIDVDVKKSIGEFDGELTMWTSDGTNEFDFTVAPTSDLTLYPVWTINTQMFTISGSHNIDLNEGGTISLYSGSESEGTSVEKIELTSANLSNFTITDSNNLVSCSLDGNGSLIVKPQSGKTNGGTTLNIARKYEISGGANAITINSTFEIEIGSYNKLEESQLKKGIATARQGAEVSGEIYIPRRYHDSSTNKWISISRIDGIENSGKGAFEGTDITKVYIPVPTIIIGPNAFKECDDLNDLEFEDTNNTWGYGSGEFNPATGSVADFIAYLVAGNSSDKTPTSHGLEFYETTTEDGSKAYNVCASDDSTFKPGEDILIPALATVGNDHRATSTRNGFPVVGFYTKTGSKGAFESETQIKTFTVHPTSNLKSIGDAAFKSCTTLEMINFLPKNNPPTGNEITSIGKESFAYCTGFNTISLPTTIESIDNAAFKGCALQEITLSESLKTAGENIFDSCSNLAKVDISETKLEVIPTGMFNSCPLLNQIEIPYFVNEINVAFSGTVLESAVFQDYTAVFKDGTNTINVNSNDAAAKISNASALKSATATYIKQVTSESKLFEFEQIGTSKECRVITYNEKEASNKHKVNIPSYCTIANSNGISTYPVVEIKEGLFKGNTNITNVFIPNTVKTIGESAFEGCTNLSTINLPNNTLFEIIYSYTFKDCTNLKSISIPTTVIEIRQYAFKNCGLTSANFNNSTIIGQTWCKKKNPSAAAAATTAFAANFGSDYSENASQLKSATNERTIYKYYIWNENVTPSINVMKTTFVKGEAFTPNDVSIKLYSDNGYTTNLDPYDSKVTYYEAKSHSTPIVGWPKWHTWENDITSKVKAGTYKPSSNVKIKINVFIDGNEYSTYKWTDYDSAIQLNFVEPTKSTEFEYRTFTDNTGTMRAEIYKSSSENYGDKIVLPSEWTSPEYGKLQIVSVGDAPGSENNDNARLWGFESLSADVKTFIMPDTIRNIGERAFWNDNFSSIVMSANLVNIMADAFATSDGVSKKITANLYIPSTVKYIEKPGEFAMKLDFNISKVVYQDPSKQWLVDSIGSRKFYFQYKPSESDYAANATYFRNQRDSIFVTDKNYDPINFM